VDRRDADNTFEVAIVGGALVGAALARALRGTRLAMVAKERPREPAAEAGFDSRVYAVSPANAAFLAGLGAWRHVPEARRTPVRAMRIYGDDGASALEFDAYRAGYGELAWIVEDGWLQAGLWRELEAQEGLARFEAAALRGLEFGGTHALLALQDGRELRARLVVGADGARSPVRQLAGIASEDSDYGQTAVVANFACGRPHRGVAYQWFQGPAMEGAVLALLPLPGEHVSMVWSAGEAQAARLLAMEPAALAREVAAASKDAVGELALVTAPQSFPLQRLATRKLVAARLSLAGDAAHVVHPLAGQGANLGLQDAHALAAVLNGREPGRDPGDERLLRRYERARAEDILAMRATVHGLQRLFDARGGGIARLRNAGLGLVDRLPVLKNLLMRRAMGLQRGST